MKTKEMTALVSNAFKFKTKNSLFGVSSKSRGKQAKVVLELTFPCAHMHMCTHIYRRPSAPNTLESIPNWGPVMKALFLLS